MPFDSSKDSFYLHLLDQWSIASTKAKRCLELDNEPFFLEEKHSSARLIFKKIFIFEFEDRESISHVDKTSTKVFENESNDSKSKPSCDLTSRPVIFEFSEKNLIFPTT